MLVVAAHLQADVQGKGRVDLAQAQGDGLGQGVVFLPVVVGIVLPFIGAHTGAHHEEEPGAALLVQHDHIVPLSLHVGGVPVQVDVDHRLRMLLHDLQRPGIGAADLRGLHIRGVVDDGEPLLLQGLLEQLAQSHHGLGLIQGLVGVLPRLLIGVAPGLAVGLLRVGVVDEDDGVLRQRKLGLGEGIIQVPVDDKIVAALLLGHEERRWGGGRRRRGRGRGDRGGRGRRDIRGRKGHLDRRSGFRLIHLHIRSLLSPASRQRQGAQKQDNHPAFQRSYTSAYLVLR